MLNRYFNRSNNQVQSAINSVKQMGNPQTAFSNLYQSNPQFRQFADSMRGKTNQCFATYQATFNGNIAIPEGGTVGAIAVAITVNGEPRPTSRAVYVPAAVDTYGNVTSTAIIKVPCGCCFSLSVEYVNGNDDPSTAPAVAINVQNANLVIDRIA